MYKFIGFIIVLVSCVKIGFDISEKYRSRTKELFSLINAFEIICKEINFTTDVIGDAFLTTSSVRNKTIKDMFLGISKVLKSSIKTPYEAYKEYIDLNRQKFALNSDDFEVLSNYFSRCGKGDVCDEINNIDSAIASLKINVDMSLNNENKYVKLYRFTGLFAGLMVGIIFI